MHRFIPILICFTLIFGLISCEKNIDVDFPPGESPFVIEGSIENGQPPLIFISKGIPFLRDISNESFRNLFVDHAHVSISIDGGTPITLDKISIEGITIYTSLTINGEIGKRYDLQVDVDGKIFRASTKIPEPHKIDSIVILPGLDSLYERDSLVELKAYFTEPNPPGNYYRLLTKRNSEIFFDTPFGSLFDDQLFNGTQIEFNIFKGKREFQNNDSADFTLYRHYKRGDTVYVKWASVEKEHFDFWNTFGSQGNSFGNPFAPTVVIKSNIEGRGSVGIWGSYGAHIDTLIIP